MLYLDRLGYQVYCYTKAHRGYRVSSTNISIHKQSWATKKEMKTRFHNSGWTQIGPFSLGRWKD